MRQRHGMLGLGLAMSAMLSGCPLEGATEAIAQCEQRTLPPQILVSFEAKVLQPGTDRVIATIQAGSMGGGIATGRRQHSPKGLNSPTSTAVDIGAVLLIDGVATGSAELRQWRDATLAGATACGEDQDCDAVAAWEKSGAQRDVEIVARTADGIEIAKWRFNDAFVADLSLAAGEDQAKLASLRFVPALAGFRTGSVESLPGDVPVTEAKLSKADAGITEESIQQFITRYQSPEGFLAYLNRGAEGKAAYLEASLERCSGDRSTSVPLCVSTGREAGSGMATGRRSTPAGERNKHNGDYLPAHNFKIEIDGVIAGGFKEVSGLESEVEVIEYRNGDDPITHKRPGKTKYKNIVLKRGLEGDAPMLPWYKKVLSGKTERKSGSIIYLDREGNEVLRYNFFEAWPVRWKAPELNSSSDTHIVEEIEFVVEKVERG